MMMMPVIPYGSYFADGFGTNSLRSISYFFFQAEDGIRDVAVTGVQTCALPIYGHYKFDHWRARLDFGVRYGDRKADNANFVLIAPVYGCDVRYKAVDVILDGGEIGRASCRERV